MDDLPEEIVVKILSCLSPYRDFSAARLVCQKWHRVINTIIKSLKRELQNAVQNGDLAYTKLDFAAARPARLVRGRERELAISTSRSHRRTNFSGAYEPSPRFSHNACIAGGFLYVFGGCSLSSSSSNSTFNDLHQFDLVKKSWQRITVNRGYMPAPRECASMVAYDGKLVIFGGWCSPRSTEVTGVPKFFNDAAIVDIGQRSCQEIKVLDRQVPGTRAGHGACVLKDKMVVFGGAQRILRYDDVWFLDMSSLLWYCPSINGEKPNGRFGHSQFPAGESHVLVIGGCGGSNTLFDDAWLLNTHSWQWTQIKTENKIWQPPDIWCHPLAKIGEIIVTFSDQTVCNTCIGWHGNPLQSSLFDGPVPVPSVTCSQCKENKVKKQNYDSHFQLYVLDISNVIKTATATWTSKPSFVPQSVSRSRSLFTITGGRAELFIFGGVFNMEKLKINNCPPTGLIMVKAK
ncbi:F-box only protein 42-like [Rhopilema esculentum]|uniref:F-box only protein 42-like n=1 Tax=Rhopilema esculentum TaxID=499914 RepID=UPI0031DFFF93